MIFSFGNPKSIRRLQYGTPAQGMQKSRKGLWGPNGWGACDILADKGAENAVWLCPIPANSAACRPIFVFRQSQAY
jgi:hypothetical protein